MRKALKPARVWGLNALFQAESNNVRQTSRSWPEFRAFFLHNFSHAVSPFSALGVKQKERPGSPRML
jgi:hypothetical protein